MADKGMGRGLAAILQVSGQHGDTAGAARDRDRADRSKPGAAAAPLRRGRARLARRLARHAACSSRSSSARCRRALRAVAGERRWRAAQLAGLDMLPALVDARRRMPRWRWRSSRTWRARTSTRSRRRARRRARRGARAHARGRRPPRRPQPRRDLEPDQPARPPRRRARAARGRPAQRRPRPRAAARRRARRAPPPRRDAASEGWSVRVPEEKAREAGRDRARRRGQPAPAPRPGEAADDIAEALGAVLGSEVRVRPRGAATGSS